MDLQCDLEKANLEITKNKQIIEKMKKKEESNTDTETQKENSIMK